MNTLRAYLKRYSLTLLNAAVIGVVYIVGIAARPHASVATTARLFDWFNITPEVTMLLFVLSVLAMASPWYLAKYAALIMPGLYAASSLGYAWGEPTLTLVAGLQHPAMVVMMLYGVRMEERRNGNER